MGVSSDHHCSKIRACSMLWPWASLIVSSSLGFLKREEMKMNGYSCLRGTLMAAGHPLPCLDAPCGSLTAYPFLLTGQDLGEDGSVHRDHLHPLHALREEARPGAAAAPAGHALWWSAGAALPAPCAICCPEACHHLLPRRWLDLLQHR